MSATDAPHDSADSAPTPHVVRRMPTPGQEHRLIGYLLHALERTASGVVMQPDKAQGYLDHLDELGWVVRR